MGDTEGVPGQKERSSISWFTSQMVTTKPVAQISTRSLSHGWQGATHLSHLFAAFPSALEGTWVGSEASVTRTSAHMGSGAANGSLMCYATALSLNFLTLLCIIILLCF